jgi:hypothetical protein
MEDFQENIEQGKMTWAINIQEVENIPEFFGGSEWPFCFKCLI